MSNIYQFKAESKINPNGGIKRTPIREAIAIILQNPRLLHDRGVTGKLIKLNPISPEIEFLLKVVNIIPVGLTAGTVLDSLRTSNAVSNVEMAKLASLMAWELPISKEEDYLLILKDALDKLIEKVRKNELDVLQTKSREFGLSRIEKMKLEFLVFNGKI